MLLTIAHRGDPSAHRENTIPSFRSAVAKGANTLEFDLRLTRDGEIAVLHDPSLERLWGVPAALADLTLAELRTMDGGGYQVPLFADLVDEFTDVAFLVDLKTDDVVTPAVTALRKHPDAFDRAIFVAARRGGREALVRLRRDEPDAVIGLDWTEPRPPSADLLAAMAPQYFGPRWAVADAAGVPVMRERGYRVWVGPLADSGQVADALAYGVDGIVADDIAGLLSLANLVAGV